MKRSVYLLALLALVSLISGVLLSDASWIGRVGITFLHKEYNFLKIWWQGATAIFLIYLLLVYAHNTISNKFSLITARIIHFVLLLIVIAGLYLTYNDFTHTFSHRLLGKRFHYGFYLFWIGWVIICLYYILKKNSAYIRITDRDKTEQANR